MIDLDSYLRKVLPLLDIETIEYLKARAVQEIVTYLNSTFTEEEILERYKYAVGELVIYYNGLTQQGNAVSVSQGQRSVTYKQEEGLPKHIKCALPRPFLKAGGVKRVL